MITVSKLTFLQGTVAALVSLPVAAASISMSANSAKAAFLQGGFVLSPGTNVGFGSSSVTLTKNSLEFFPQSITPIAIQPLIGSFTEFNTGNIRNNISFGTPVKPDNLFIDLGSLPISGVILPNTDTTSLTDGKNTFTLTNSTYKMIPVGNNVVVDVSLSGFFTGDNPNAITNSVGIISFSIGNTTITDIEEILNKGSGISGLTFSGAFFTNVCGRCGTIPEPATILGLGLVGGAMAISLRRKNVA
ncbi:PEP-CTERM sorting domain-containing protein [Anabaena sp. CCY 9910]|uniref:PEP-CTERM sorting domain-containing protein n=1 Tax=Anabaena sp. CCY 9910 TaxID=3103870 RepID=UPI0039DF66E4